MRSLSPASMARHPFVNEIFSRELAAKSLWKVFVQEPEFVESIGRSCGTPCGGRSKEKVGAKKDCLADAAVLCLRVLNALGFYAAGSVCLSTCDGVF